jgi:hypothetical protein
VKSTYSIIRSILYSGTVLSNIERDWIPCNAGENKEKKKMRTRVLCSIGRPLSLSLSG